MVYEIKKVMVFKVQGHDLWVQRVCDVTMSLIYVDKQEKAQKFTEVEADAWSQVINLLSKVPIELVELPPESTSVPAVMRAS